MKTILNILLLSAIALCELPPPYLQHGFRPSPHFHDQTSNIRHPQNQYGPPRLTSNSLDVKIPSKLTIEQLIRLTEQLQSSQARVINKPQTVQLSTPQSSYLPPPRQPQRVYGPPKKIVVSQSQLGSSSALNFGISQPHRTYGVPQESPQIFKPLTQPQNQYLSPQSLSGSQSIPQTSYGVPNVQQVPSQSNNFGAFNNQAQIPPSTSYGVPLGIPDLRSIETLDEQRNKPQNDQSILRQNLLNDLSKQHLPYREPSGFRPQGSQSNEVQNIPGVNQQYLPANSGNNERPQNGLGSGQQGNINNNLLQGSQGQGSNSNYIPQNSGGTGEAGSPSRPQNVPNVNQQYLPAKGESGGQRPQNIQPGNIPSNVPQNIGGGNIPQNPGSTNGDIPNNGGAVNNIGQNYLPPQTTTRPVFATGRTTLRPRTIGTTTETPEKTTNYDYDYDLQQPTEAPSNQDESTSDPNVAISNAVAGGGGFFYLQQPDGRLQRVVLQKTHLPNGKPEEYVANYYFQNIQALPSVPYAPLLSLGNWK